MNELTIKTDGAGIQTVSARELHAALQSAERFSKWWDRMASYGFEESVDYTSVQKSTEVQNNGGVQERVLQEYYITIDMAKQICMLQRSELGKQYREYFLKLEKAWNTPEAIMARAMEMAKYTLEHCFDKIKVLQPKADVYDELVDRSYCKNFRDTAAMLGISQSSFMNLLRSKYIYKTTAGEYRAYAEFQKYFVLKTFKRGEDKTGNQLMVSMEGIEYFTKLLKKRDEDSLFITEAV